MTHDQPCPPAGVCGGAAGDGVSDLGTCHASDAVLAAVVSRPGQYQSVTGGDGNGFDASRVHWHDELCHLASAARGLSLVDGGTDHESSDNQFVTDGDLRVDIDGGVYDQQRGDHGQHHGHDGQSDVSGARGRSHGDHLCDDVCQCRGGHDAVSVGRAVRTGRVIREATVDDIPVLVAMGMRFAQSDAYKHIVRDNPVQFEKMARMLITSGLGVMLVLEKNGCVEGMIGMLCTPHFLSGDMFAGEICWWINPEHRGDGVRLMRSAETWAREQGALSIQMVAPNERVGSLYERMGYQQTETSYQKLCNP